MKKVTNGVGKWLGVLLVLLVAAVVGTGCKALTPAKLVTTSIKYKDVELVNPKEVSIESMTIRGQDGVMLELRGYSSAASVEAIKQSTLQTGIYMQGLRDAQAGAYGFFTGGRSIPTPSPYAVPQWDGSTLPSGLVNGLQSAVPGLVPGFYALPLTNGVSTNGVVGGK